MCKSTRVDSFGNNNEIYQEYDESRMINESSVCPRGLINNVRDKRSKVSKRKETVDRNLFRSVFRPALY